MKLSGKQLTTAVLIGLMGISAGGVVMAKPPIVQPTAVSTPSGGQQDPHSNPQGTQPPAGGQGQQDPKKTTDELIAEIQTNLTNQGKELDKKATKDELEKYATKDEMNDALSKKADASDVTALAAQLGNKADKNDLETNYAKKSDLDKYTKTEDLNKQLQDKADKTDLAQYTKTEDLNKQLQDKADKSALTDYVRKSDLKIGNNAKDIANNAKDIQKVGARAAALAGLHPLEFDPSTKLSFAVSSGSYDGENSVAFGAFYRPAKNVMFSAASTMGSKNAYTFGMSFKFGQSSAMTTTNTPDVQELYRVVGQLQYQLAAQQQEIQQLRQAAQKTK